MSAVTTVEPPPSPSSGNGQDVLVFPTTVGQGRFWYLDALQPGNRALNMPLAARFSGPLDVRALELSVDAVLRRHEVLRSRYVMHNDELVQVVEPHRPFVLIRHDALDCPPERRDERIEEWMNREAATQFNLAEAPLLRATLVQLSPVDHLLLFTLHHIACDGWSNGILLREVAQHYTTIVQSGGLPPSDELPLQYADYAVWQKNWLQTPEAAAQRAYWLDHLGGLVPVLNLPTDRPRRAKPTLAGSIRTLLLPLEFTQALRELCQREGYTPFMLFFGAYTVLLHRYSARNDFVVGTPAACRNQVELEEVIGLFANPLLIRARIGPALTFRRWLEQVRHLTLEGFSRQEYPFELIAEQLRMDPARSGVPWLQAYFVYQKAFMKPQKLPDAELIPLRSVTAGAMFEWMLGVLERDEGVRLQLEFNTDLFDGATIDLALRHFQAILEQARINLDFSITDFPLIPEASGAGAKMTLEKCPEGIPGFLAAPANGSLNECGRITSVQELLAQADRAAAIFRFPGVETPQRIAFHVSSVTDAVIAAIAIWKAGHVAVPFKTENSDDSMDRLRKEAGASWLVQRKDEVWLCQPIPEASPDQGETASEDRPAMVLWTSGRAGGPRALQVSAAQFASHVRSVRQALGVVAGDRVLATAPLDSALGWEELFVGLVTGSTVMTLEPGLADRPEALIPWLEKHCISVAQLPAGLWTEALRTASEPLHLPPAMRLVALAGQTVAPHAARVWREAGPASRLVARFATAETLGTALLRDFGVSGSGSLGHPIPGTRIEILDDRSIPVTTGLPGTIRLSTDWGLAVPCLPGSTPAPDLGRRLTDATFEYLGRGDDLARTSGFRLEFREVQLVASQHPAVWDVFPLASSRTDFRGFRLLFTCRPGVRMADGELREFLRDQLPAYFAPDRVIPCDRLLLDAHGRSDWKALESLVFKELDGVPYRPSRSPEAVPESGCQESTNWSADGMEADLAAMFAQLLGMSQVRPTDSFFNLGGHSLLAVRLFARIEQRFSRRLPLATLIANPSAALLAKVLRTDESCDQASWKSLVPIQPHSHAPVLFLVHGAGGNILLYRDLARHLGGEVALYGLQSRGLDGNSPPLSRIEEMAAAYVREVVEFQPRGPYLLGGYCMGGSIAYEMARILTGQGREVQLVALLDSFNVHALRTAVSPRSRRRIWAEKIGFHFRNLVALKPRDAAAYLGEKARMAFELAGGMVRSRKGIQRNPADLGANGFVQDLNHQALRKYAPGAYSGRITVIKPSRNYGVFHDPHMGWEGLAAGGSNLVTLEMNPHAMLVEPYVRQLAAALRSHLHHLPNS